MQLYRFVNLARGSVIAMRVRLAGTSRERRRGLLQTTSLHADAGLWIIPCEAIHTFGMRLAIDAVFLDKDLRVCSLRRNLRPSRIAFSLKAHSVLELPAGTILRSGTVLGDQLDSLPCKTGLTTPMRNSPGSPVIKPSSLPLTDQLDSGAATLAAASGLLPTLGELPR